MLIGQCGNYSNGDLRNNVTVPIRGLPSPVVVCVYTYGHPYSTQQS